MAKKKKIYEDENVPHDPKTCFRCRLHDLYEELKDKDNSPRFMCVSMAEACGTMLSQLGPEDFKMFLVAVTTFYSTGEFSPDEIHWPTKH